MVSQMVSGDPAVAQPPCLHRSELGQSLARSGLQVLRRMKIDAATLRWQVVLEDYVSVLEVAPNSVRAVAGSLAGDVVLRALLTGQVKPPPMIWGVECSLVK